MELLGRKKNPRVLEGTATWSANTMDLKRVRGGLLVQDRAPAPTDPQQWTVVSSRQPTAAEQRDLLFAWQRVASV